MKHNKKRNTAFLYECLIKEMTKAVVRKDLELKEQIVRILKQYFSKGSVLAEDLQMYKELLETKDLKESLGIRFIEEVKKDWEALDRKSIFNEQTQLIKEFNNLLPEAFGNFIPNYKNIATIGQYFNSDGLKPKTRLLIEERIKTLVISQSEAIKEQSMKPIDSLEYNTFVNKFNQAYKHSLLQEQRELLTNYITSFSDNGLGLKSFMNEELGRLKEECQSLSEGKWSDKISLVREKIESFKTKPLTEEVVKDIFYIQDLIAEIKKNE
tara:strand:+ start:429 stop:1232 length:804 start_codon:yes stop_codon:yes gene_type:complete